MANHKSAEKRDRQAKMRSFAQPDEQVGNENRYPSG